jgi:hypothetical protein
VTRLAEAGFVFDQTQPEWERKYSQLQAFHVEFGHCCVPQRWVHKPARRFSTHLRLINWGKV